MKRIIILLLILTLSGCKVHKNASYVYEIMNEERISLSYTYSKNDSFKGLKDQFIIKINDSEVVGYFLNEKADNEKQTCIYYYNYLKDNKISFDEGVLNKYNYFAYEMDNDWYYFLTINENISVVLKGKVSQVDMQKIIDNLDIKIL